jgi:hypothetical protein
LATAESLTPELRDRIRSDLAVAMPRHEVSTYLSAKQHILTHSDHVAVVEDAGRIVGVMAASDLAFSGPPGCYIESLLVAEGHHGSTLAIRLTTTLFAGIVDLMGTFPDLVAMKTYTPKAYRLMQRFAVDDSIGFFPEVGKRARDDVRLLATQLASLLAPECEFQADTGVLTGGAGLISSDFWHHRPLCDDESVNEYFRREVGSADRVLCLVHAPTSRAKAALLKALQIAPPTARRMSSTQKSRR